MTTDLDDAVVYSPGYATHGEAIEACVDHVDKLEWESQIEEDRDSSVNRFEDAPTTLPELLALLRSGSRWVGAPTESGELDWTSLPTFGGPEPKYTECVWSWDEDSLISGRCADELEISSRVEYEASIDEVRAEMPGWSR